jgi:protein SCO1/2
LKALSQEYGLGPDWRLLRGSQDQVRELAAVLGVKYRKVSETDFAHSNTITILDADGTVSHQKQELGTGVEDSAKAVNNLLAEPSPCCAEEP